MYCIISLPRTASTHLWHLLYSPLVFQDVRYQGQPSHSIFNPRYNTAPQLEEKFHNTLTTTTPVLFKMISNHNFSHVERVLNSKRFTTIMVMPRDVKKFVLKTIVAKQTDSFAVKGMRDPYRGRLVITEQEIQERLTHYDRHMAFRDRCDHAFFDSDVLSRPQDILHELGMPEVKNKYVYRPPRYTDIEMLQDVEQFNMLYDQLSQSL